MGEISVKTGNNARNGGKNSLNRLIRCVCGKKIGPDPRNFNQRVSLGRNDLLIRTFLTSQGFIEDSHLDLFLRNAYIKRDYRVGLPDKAEWGQGIIATFESGFTQGPVGFGVDGIAQYAVRLDGGRGRSGAGGIDFFAQDDDGRAKSD
ncbi:OprD family outer membrane porin, partial [Acinetobacter baumannii]|uniref:OprD family outer membrane porin n=1 Tax=Acinetobacter baumannii TaxID=470 RepID=UPI000E2AE59B